MLAFQFLSVYALVLLVLGPVSGGPVSGRCVDETFCLASLEEYHSHLIDVPNRINERSVAAWRYVEKIDLDRVPQVIYEANCLTSHSCRDVDSPFSLESIPISIKMPVLRKSRRCSSYSLEFETVTIACICATTRQSNDNSPQSRL
ncbi:hypothetical protein ANANG_G00186170 [Anguilla anguilla]|uniref:Uncharacterized protein n=1 Tax=Anguilla anguilla TaxID=7936 RepID=A0A9D3M042_ANGAN|nr:hypothetical protein ANANG_G00186170 [Anguilla anguilla]